MPRPAVRFAPVRPARVRLAAALLAACAAVALPRAAAAQGVEPSCAAAGQAAERQWSLPSGLLGAIGQVESGRRGIPGAWPWTINAAGQGYHFDGKEEAIRVVQLLQARGVRSIDVGCFQINLQHHPGAFTSLEQAFDPASNAQYAARFLDGLRERTGSWEGAIGAYHSATPERGDAYRARVMAAWSGAPLAMAAPRLASLPARGMLIPVSAASRSLPLAPTRVWSISSQAMGVRVWSATPQPGYQGASAQAALPRVIAGPPPSRR